MPQDPSLIGMIRSLYLAIFGQEKTIGNAGYLA